MKKLYGFLFLLGIFVCGATALWSCSDNDDPAPEPEPEPQPGVTAEAEVEEPSSDDIFATSATFRLKTKGVESYVYRAVEGAGAAQPDAAAVYAEAEENGEVVPVTGETTEVLVTGLEGEKTYTVFFICKVASQTKAEAESPYIIRSQEITTAKYTQIVTVLSTEMFSMKVHVEVPEDVYYYFGFTNLVNFEGMKGYGMTDVDWVTWLGPAIGMEAPRYKGPRNITISNDVSLYKDALNEYWDLAQKGESWWTEEDLRNVPINPGMAYMILVEQCDENGDYEGFVTTNNIGEFGGGSWLAAKQPDVKEYTETPEIDTGGFTGLFSKTILFSQEPGKGTGKMNITQKATEKKVTVSLTPTGDILSYKIFFVDDLEKETLTTLAGGEEKGIQALVLSDHNPDELHTGAVNVTYNGLEKDHTYTLYVTGICNEDGTVQTFDKLEGIKTIESTQPAVELTVTPLRDGNPYKASWNVKAPNSDCAGFKYLMFYTKDLMSELGGAGGMTEESVSELMGFSSDGYIDDSNVLKAVNSSEGFNMDFSTIDETESWLFLESYNAEDKTKLFFDGDNYRITSGSIPAEEPVESDLFNSLKGAWTATMSSVDYRGEVSVPVSMPVTIAAGPDRIPTLPADVKSERVKYYMENQGDDETEAQQKVEKYFKEFQERTDYYTTKYKKQNCLVATGFTYNESRALATPWDLFQSTSYSGYGTDDMFRDYGPKLLLKIGKDSNGKDSVTVITTAYDENGYYYTRYVDPVSDWAQNDPLYLYARDGSNQADISDFPVEISEDGNTITIRQTEKDGRTLTPSFIVEYRGRLMWDFMTAGNIVLTRSADNTQGVCNTRSFSAAIPEVSAHSGHHFRRTSTPYGFRPKKSIQGNVFSVEHAMKNLKK